MSSLEYFRGVNFHVNVLEKRAQILELMPSFTSGQKPIKLNDIDDSTKLGQIMLDYNVIRVLCADPTM